MTKMCFVIFAGVVDERASEGPLPSLEEESRPEFCSFTTGFHPMSRGALSAPRWCYERVSAVVRRAPAASSSSSRAWSSPLVLSGRPESRRAISATRSSPSSCCTLLAVTSPEASLTTPQVVGRERRDLCEVRDDDDLGALGQLGQPTADLDRRRTADARRPPRRTRRWARSLARP